MSQRSTPLPATPALRAPWLLEPGRKQGASADSAPGPPRFARSPDRVDVASPRSGRSPDRASEKPPWSRREKLALAGLVLLALIVHLVYAVALARVVWGDEPFYLWLGQSLWAGTGYTIFGYPGSHFPPLFPLLAGGLARLSGGLLNASNALYVLSSALLVLPLYAAARLLYGRAAALATGLIVAVYPALASGVLAWGTMTEPLYLLLIAMAIYALQQGMEEGRPAQYLLLAAALGLAYLTRTEAVVFALVSLGLLAVVRLLRRDRPLRVLGWTAAAGGLFLLIASPYLLYIRAETGRWSLSGAAGMAYVSMEGLAQGDAAAFDRATWQLDPASGEVYLFAPASESEGLAAALLADPLAVLRRLRANGREALDLLFSLRLTPLALASLALLGLFSRPWDPRLLRGHLALLASLAGPLSYLPFFVQDRYLAGLLLPALIWMGAGAAALGDWLAGSWEGLRGGAEGEERGAGGGALRMLPLLLIAGYLLWQGPRLWTVMQRTHSFQPGHLAAAAALRSLGATAEDTLLSRYPAIAFHAGMRWAATPAEDWPTVEAYARQRAASFLALDGWEGQLRPQLDFLLIPSQAPPALCYVDTIEAGPDPVLLYAFCHDE